MRCIFRAAVAGFFLTTQVFGSSSCEFDEVSAENIVEVAREFAEANFQESGGYENYSLFQFFDVTIQGERAHQFEVRVSSNGRTERLVGFADECFIIEMWNNGPPPARPLGTKIR